MTILRNKKFKSEYLIEYISQNENLFVFEEKIESFCVIPRHEHNQITYFQICLKAGIEFYVSLTFG